MLVTRHARLRDGLLSSAAAVLLSAPMFGLASGSAYADGGAGGSACNGTVTGGAGGTGFTGGSGSNGGFSLLNCSGEASGGGGGAAGGGAGGSGGSDGLGDLGGNGGTGGSNGNGAGSSTITNTAPLTGSDGGTGGDGTGSNNASGGGGGGAGGYGAIVTGSGTDSNSSTIAGGNGGAGGVGQTAGSGGSGGDGGIGVFYTTSGATFTNSGTVTGGNGGAGGAGGSANGAGGAGGIGIEGNGITIVNSGTITGGNGGVGSTDGLGGIGIEGSDLTVINSGTISGGFAGDGSTRAAAIKFTGGTNTLELQAGSTIVGSVLAFSAADTLRLGGSANSSFDVSAIGAQYQGFGNFAKTGTSTWTLTGTTSAVTSWQIDQGTLAISSDTNLGAASGGLGFDGGTLQLLASLSSARAITLNAGGGTIDTNTHIGTLSGTISGSGALTKVGAGTLTLSGSNTYNGGTVISAGTLAISSDSNLGASSGGITFSGGTLQLLGALSSARTIVLSGSGGTVDTNGFGATLSGLISGSGALTKTGSGALTLSGNDTYTGATIINAGTLIVDGSIADSSSTTVKSGATLSGAGTVSALSVFGGGTVAPGSAGTTLSVNGNATFSPGSTYAVQMTSSSTDLLSISGTAALSGTLNLQPTGGTFTLGQEYTVLTAAGGISGTFQGVTTTGSFGTNRVGEVSYDGNDVFVTIDAASITPFLPANASTNQKNVTAAIDYAMAHDGAIPVFAPLALLSPSDLENALDSFTGEVAAGTQDANIDAMNGFLETLDSKAALTGPASNSQYASRYDYVQLADNDSPDGLISSPSRKPKLLEVWVTFHGQHNSTQADASLGTHATQANDLGATVGFGYRAPSGKGTIGIAIGYDNLTWKLAKELGKGHAGAYQGGLYGSLLIDQTYISGTATFGTYDATTDRSFLFPGTTSNSYHAKLSANSEGAHLEVGENISTVLGHLAPYIRGSLQDLHTPAYTENTVSGSPAFALSYDKVGHVDLTSEVGASYNANLSEAEGDAFGMRLRLGWLHDYSAGLKDSATFSGFSGATFTVHGASPPKDAAHAIIGIEQDFQAVAFTLDAEVVLATSSQSVGAANAGIAYRW